MSTANVDLVQWGGHRARLTPWRGDASVGQITPSPGDRSVTGEFVRRCVDAAWRAGYSRVLTSAVPATEQSAFLAAGFHVLEQLHLLVHDLRELPDSSPADLRRARREDWDAVLAIDARSFSEFWRLDTNGLNDAIAATPTSRFRVLLVDGAVAGYAVTGRAGRRGYVQRLAVDAAHRRAGHATALVCDGLRWLRRWRAATAWVNTQLDNLAALALYERLGFRREPAGLVVLEYGQQR